MTNRDQDQNKHKSGDDMNKQQHQQNQGNKQQGDFHDDKTHNRQQQQDRSSEGSGQQGGFSDKNQKQDMGGKAGSGQNR